MKKEKAITLIALIVTIVILLILAGVAIASLGGENGLIARVSQAKKAQIKAEMKEQLVLALSELQLEKNGEATLDDVTQDWADNTLKGYEPIITNDASTNGKKVTMTKSGIIGKYIIDEKLNIVETEENDSSIEFSYDILERIDNKVNILIHVRDKENGLTKIEFPDTDLIIANGTKEERGIDYKVEIGTEYKIKITSESGEEREETILITDYWYKITKNLAEGISIDNAAVKEAYNKTYQATLTTGNEYVLETLTVTMGGQAVTTSGNNIIDITTGVINIEKVTGDIEITATTKKLEIRTTEPYIGTSRTITDATQSVADNSQTKGSTTLYINFTATLEGNPCTMTIKDGTSVTLPYAVTSNGTYIFVATGTYNGKTISEEKEVIVNKYQAAQNLVKYDAGDWTETEIQSLQTAGLYNLNASKTASNTSGSNFTFGGFTYKGDTQNETNINNGTIVTSRNQSVAPQSGLGTPKYDGWQILEIKDSSGNIISNETEISSKLDNLKNEKIYVTKLVHAGCPENFVYYYTRTYDAYRVEYILSSGLRQPGYNTYNPRSWQMYIDNSQRNLIADTTDKDENTVKDIHAMTYDEALAIAGSTGNTTGIRNTGSYYWLGSAHGNKFLWFVLYDGIITDNFGGCYGVRPVVSLKSGVYIASGEGTEASPYVLGIE